MKRAPTFELLRERRELAVMTGENDSALRAQRLQDCWTVWTIAKMFFRGVPACTL